MTQRFCRRPCSLLFALSQLEGNRQTISHSSPWPSQRLQQLQQAMGTGAASVCCTCCLEHQLMACAWTVEQFMDSSSAVRNCRWAFDAVLDTLAVMFGSSFAAHTSSSSSSSNGTETAQAAAALCALAKGVHSDQQASLAMCKRLLILHNNTASDLLSPPEQRSAEHDPALAAAALRQLTLALAMAVEGASRGAAAHSSQELTPVAALMQNHFTYWNVVLVRPAQQ
jgi:hypothetical protein